MAAGHGTGAARVAGEGRRVRCPPDPRDGDPERDPGLVLPWRAALRPAGGGGGGPADRGGGGEGGGGGARTGNGRGVPPPRVLGGPRGGGVAPDRERDPRHPPEVRDP